MMSDPPATPPHISPLAPPLPISTSGINIAATVEAAFERAVPDLMHERLHAVRDAARAGAATCEGLSAAGGRQSRREYQAGEANGPRPAILGREGGGVSRARRFRSV